MPHSTKSLFPLVTTIALKRQSLQSKPNVKLETRLQCETVKRNLTLERLNLTRLEQTPILIQNPPQLTLDQQPQKLPTSAAWKSCDRTVGCNTTLLSPNFSIESCPSALETVPGTSLFCTPTVAFRTSPAHLTQQPDQAVF